MKLPNADSAEVALEKLRDYCLNPEHPRGRHKARVFLTALGVTRRDAAWLRDQLLSAARREEATVGEQDAFGQRFVLDFSLTFGTRSATVRSSWIVRRSEDYPRLTSCFVL